MLSMAISLLDYYPQSYTFLFYTNITSYFGF